MLVLPALHSERPEVSDFIPGFVSKFLVTSVLRFSSLLIVILAEAVTLLSGWPIVPVETQLIRQSVFSPKYLHHISNTE